MNAPFTVNGVQVRLDETIKYQHFGYCTLVTPVRLAEAYRGHPAGTLLGRVQSRTGRRARERAITSGLRAVCVSGVDYAWLMRDFDEHQCGDLQARREAIRAGASFRATRTFGYLGEGHDCVYAAGDQVRVLAVFGDVVRTSVTRSVAPQGTRPEQFEKTLCWSLEALRSLVTDFTLRHEA